MRVLLDESVPRRLAAAFPEAFGTRTVQQMDWAGWEPVVSPEAGEARMSRRGWSSE